jgi:hypothetical protein
MAPQQTVARNESAESELRLDFFRRFLDRQQGKVEYPVPPSPFQTLSTPVGYDEPASVRALSELLFSLNPSQMDVKGLGRSVPSDLYLRATQAGIPPTRTNVVGTYGKDDKRIYVDPDWSWQSQYDTALHELSHAAGRGERDTREFSKKHQFGQPKNETRPSVLGQPLPPFPFRKK